MIRYHWKFRVGSNKSHSVVMSAKDGKEKREMVEKILAGNPDYPPFSEWKLVSKDWISDHVYNQY